MQILVEFTVEYDMHGHFILCLAFSLWIFIHYPLTRSNKPKQLDMKGQAS